MASEHALVQGERLTVSTDCCRDLLGEFSVHDQLARLRKLACDDHVHQRVEILLLEVAKLDKQFLAFRGDTVEVALLGGALAFLDGAGSQFDTVVNRALAEVDLTEIDLAVFLFDAVKMRTDVLVESFAEEFELGLRSVSLRSLGSGLSSGSEGVLGSGVLSSVLHK